MTDNIDACAVMLASRGAYPVCAGRDGPVIARASDLAAVTLSRLGWCYLRGPIIHMQAFISKKGLLLLNTCHIKYRL